MMEKREQYPQLYQQAFGGRPKYELYKLATDPGQTNNLAQNPEYAGKLEDLITQMTAAFLKNSP